MVNENKTYLLRQKITQILDEYLGEDYMLFVFGSYIKNEVVRSSDIDLAVYKKGKISSSMIVKAKDEIERRGGTLREIDLINLTDEVVNTKLLESILKEGVVWKKGKNSKELLRSLKKRLTNLKK